LRFPLFLAPSISFFMYLLYVLLYLFYTFLKIMSITHYKHTNKKTTNNNNNNKKIPRYFDEACVVYHFRKKCGLLLLTPLICTYTHHSRDNIVIV
jgi:hypothetical protein